MRIWHLSPVLGPRVSSFPLISLQQLVVWMTLHVVSICQVGVHLQLSDSFKGVIFIQRWNSLDDIRIPTKKSITLKTRNVKQELQLIKFNYVAPAFRSGELLVSNCEPDFWRRVYGEHRHLLDLIVGAPWLFDLFFSRVTSVRRSPHLTNWQALVCQRLCNGH